MVIYHHNLSIIEMLETPNSTLDRQLKERDIALGALKEHLGVAQDKMKKICRFKEKKGGVPSGRDDISKNLFI